MPDLSPPPGKTPVIAALSGGVDSAVSALLLREQGLPVEGLFMKNWEEDDGTEYCTAKEDLADAEAVCQLLDIPLHVANFSAEYWDHVFEHFLAEYRAGRTPNPDVLCNREIKFKTLLDYAATLGANTVATGHYARLRTRDGRTELLRGLDGNKDQSYFLHAVPGSQLQRARFPVGELEKPAVRALARKAGFPVHDKKDSTGLCFIGERRFSDFLARYVQREPGPIVSLDGRHLGEHTGLAFYTIGQRQGLGIGGRNDSSEAAWYVAGKDLATNTLQVVQGGEHPALFCIAIECAELNWINPPPGTAFDCTAKIRYRQSDAACHVTVAADGTCRVQFREPQRAVAPGQFAVFYAEEVCLGGGVILSGSGNP